jgi:hypothetical protein
MGYDTYRRCKGLKAASPIECFLLLSGTHPPPGGFETFTTQVVELLYSRCNPQHILS